jgi:predicted aminopeptidase
MNYEDTELVELIIHESVHATIYIKSHAEFNERLATFLGQEGAKRYYETFHPHDNKALNTLLHSSNDQNIFSQFISNEIHHLKKWYESKIIEIIETSNNENLLSKLKKNTLSSEDLFKNLEDSKYKELMDLKHGKLKQIQNKFNIEIQPQLKTSNYSYFGKIELNNAILTGYETYIKDLKEFEIVFEKNGRNFQKFLEFCKSLEKSQDPEKDLQELGKS